MASARADGTIVTFQPPVTRMELATSVRIGMGTSLGGLAMLHALCHDQDAFAGLFLQSGSFLRPRFDAQALKQRGYPAEPHELPGQVSG